MDVPGEWTGSIEGQSEWDDTISANKSVGRLEADNTCSRGGVPNRSTGVGADSDDHKSGSDGNPGAARRPEGRPCQIVRVFHLAAKRASRNSRCELRHVRFPEDDRTRVP